jgi:hypothetical protein
MLILQRSLIMLNQVLKELTVAKVPILTTAVMNVCAMLLRIMYLVSV